MKKDYSHFEVDDFITDEYFINSVIASNAKTDEFWQEWQNVHPEKIEILKEAWQIVSVMRPEFLLQYSLSNTNVEKLLEKVHEQILPVNPYATRNGASSNLPKLTKSSVGWYQMAGVLTALVVFTGILFFLWLPPQTIEVITRAGEIKNIILPDKSMVILNANSKLTYPAHWQKNKAREVQLKGEAFFSVRHQPDHQKFRVKMADNFQVEVLGTEFNILNRQATKRVVLKSGSIRLTVAEAPKQKVTQIIMEPGEAVELKDTARRITRKIVNPVHHSAWIKREIVLDNTTLEDLAQVIKDTYSLEVIFKDEKLKQKRYKGVFPSDDINVLLGALSKSFNIQVQSHNQQIIFKSVSNSPSQIHH